MTRLESEFVPRGRLEGRELLLRRKESMLLLDQCEIRGYVVLGINFFHEVASGAMQEVIGGGADFSMIADHADAVAQTVAEARAVLAKSETSSIDWFSFVLCPAT